MGRRKLVIRSAAVVVLGGVLVSVALLLTESQSSAQPRETAPVVIENTTTTTEPATATTNSIPTTTTTAVDNTKAEQQRLLDLGYWLDNADGKVGPVTQQAIYAFQKVESLPKTGKLDDATVGALATAQRPSPAATTGDLVEIDKTKQVIIVVRDGKTLWVFNTSTGTEKPYSEKGGKGVANTPTGDFKVTRVVDAVDNGPLGALYRPRYSNGGIAVHGAPVIPAYPASHGCARVSNAAMDFIWSQNLMPIGSSVNVYGESPVK